MDTKDVRTTVLEALESRAPEHGIDIVDVEVVGAQKSPCVRVRIDHADEGAPTISLDEVAQETGWISDALDELDPIEGSFTLEVSSPGMARPLRRPHDFERFAGNTVALSTTATEGRRRYTGKLLGYTEQDGMVNLEVDGEQVNIPLDQVRSCTIKPNFDSLGKKAPKGGR
ncbi:MAG: ribosome maturation factor RimP [Tractidigestivibacter sp.]|jgi:ribosome maturation factor RimP|uniref:ribosome maturation factor RimP n=1 Tax=Tractidigestivibacter sp. TaxID=2847320 RepID=UPI003D9229F1